MNAKSPVTGMSLANLKRLHAELATAIDQREQLTTPVHIQKLVEEDFHLLQNTLHSQTRALVVSRPRQVAMTLMHEAGMTWHASGTYFSLSYDAALYAAKIIAGCEEADLDFASRMQRLRTKIASTLESPSNF